MIETSQSELKALIYLLDDPDPSVYGPVKGKLVSIGLPVVKPLEEAWQGSEDELVQERIEDLVQSIQFGDVARQLEEWAQNGGEELFKGLFLVAKYQYPDLKEPAVRNQIESLRVDAWMDMVYADSPLDKVRVINNTLYRKHGFSANAERFHDPANSFLNLVLESRKGNPISLAMVYSLVAQRLEVPVYGVNLPQHFILAYLDESSDQASLPIHQRRVLFYINAFNKGMIFTEREIGELLRLIQVEEHPRFYKPCSNVDIVARMLSNLQYAFEEQQRPDKVREMMQLRRAIGRPPELADDPDAKEGEA